jgi:Ca2+-binding RTX toxin-like protein
VLRNSVTNPALSGALSFDSLGTDQLGHVHPQPSNSQPDIGAAELNQTLSTKPTANNDVLTDSDSAHTLSGGLGNDRIVGLAGNDTLNGGDGSDTFDGGSGNDKINGGTGVDIALYGGSTAVVFDLSGTTDKVTQGTAVDTLTGIEGGAGGSGADTFKGDAADNYFRGGDGKDTFTGGAGRDTYYYTSAQNSPATSGRDVITDFVHGQDKISLAYLDANPTQPGDQAFHWLGHSALGTTPGDLSWFTSGTNTIVQGSTDTDTAAEFWVQLNGNVGPSLAATDFYL